jgi:hypothetical protein
VPVESIDTMAWGFTMRPEERRRNQNDLIIGGDRFQKFTDMLSTCTQARVVMYRQQNASGRGAATP